MVNGSNDSINLAYETHWNLKIVMRDDNQQNLQGGFCNLQPMLSCSPIGGVREAT